MPLSNHPIIRAPERFVQRELVSTLSRKANLRWLLAYLLDASGFCWLRCVLFGVFVFVKMFFECDGAVVCVVGFIVGWSFVMGRSE